MGNFEDGFLVYQCEVLSKVYQKSESHCSGDRDLAVFKVHLSLWELWGIQ